MNTNRTNEGFFTKVVRFVVTMPIAHLSIVGIVLGVAFGLLVREFNPSSDLVRFISLIGNVFISALKAIVLLFVIVIMIRTPMDLKEVIRAKKFAALTIGFFVVVTFISSLFGFVAAVIVQPGRVDTGCPLAPTTLIDTSTIVKKTVLDSFFDVFDQAVPANIFEAIVKNNILGILVVFLVLGFSMAMYSNTESGIVMKHVLDILNQSNMDILDLVIMITPLGVFSLMAGELAKITDNCIFPQVGIFLATVLVTDIVFVFGVMCLLLFLVSRVNPYKFLAQYTGVIVTAISTSSSAATLPRRTCYKAGISKAVTNFVLPLGSTLNMYGTAIYFPIAINFAAYLNGQSIDFVKQIIVCFVTTLITVGSAPVPSGAIVYLEVIAVTASVKLPPETISLIWAVDPFLDRFATVANVLGDCMAAKILDDFTKRYWPSASLDYELKPTEEGEKQSRQV